MRRAVSFSAALALILAAAAPAVALPAEGSDTTTTTGSGGSTTTGSTDPIKATSDLIDQATDAAIVANTNVATGAATATQDLNLNNINDAVATLLQQQQQQLQQQGTKAIPAIPATTANEQMAALKDIVASALKSGSPGDLLKNAPGFSVKLDAAGCYDITGPNDLSFKLCEDDAGARKGFVDKASGKMVSWVNGTLTNTGAALCGVAFASPKTNLVENVIKKVPANLPVAATDIAPSVTLELNKGETLPFAFMLPFDGITPAIVGLADSVKLCPPGELPEPGAAAAVPAAGAAGAAAAAGEAATTTTEAATAAVAQVAEAEAAAQAAVAKAAEEVKPMDVQVQQAAADSTSPAAPSPRPAVLVALAAVAATVAALVVA